MKICAILAAKEFRDGLRNRWVAAAIFVLAGLTLTVTFLGSAPVGTTGGTQLSVTVASLASLSVYLVPLIALMLSYDAIVGEAERGTLLLLLAYPVTRWQLIAGKFLGQLMILTVAIVLGYGGAAFAASVFRGAPVHDLSPLITLIGSSVLLGAVFLMLGYVLSATAREQATAAGMAIGLWLAMVLIYDLALLGALMADTSHVISERTFSTLLVLNPADAFRVFNLSQFESVKAVTGLGGLGAGATLPAYVPLASMGLWTLGAALLAAFKFGARDI